MKETFKYKGFEGSMDFSPEDECLVGEVLFVRSKIIYIGETYAELKSAFQEAVDAYLMHCEGKGITPEKPCSGTFNVRVGTHLHQMAIKAAYQNDISLNEVIIRALKNLLEGDQNSAKLSLTLKNSPLSITNINSQNFNFPVSKDEKIC